MDHALRTISYIADIGNIVVLMARRRMPRSASQDCIETTAGAQEGRKQYKMICHVFESEDVRTCPPHGRRDPRPLGAVGDVEGGTGDFSNAELAAIASEFQRMSGVLLGPFLNATVVKWTGGW